MKIVTDKEFLKQKSLPVDYTTGLEIGHTLLNVLAEHPDGVGLAAPQIGLLSRVFVIKLDGYEGIFINPVLKKGADSILVAESCLSFPGEIRTISRYKTIITKNQISISSYMTTGLKNFIAIIWQHEYDHLDGITILDKGITL